MHSTIKKRSTIVLSILLLFSVLPLSRQASAAESVESTSVVIEDLGNGYTVETTTTVYADQVRVSKKSANAKSVYKHDGKEIATVILYATFSYNGSTSKCTNCSHSTTSPSSVESTSYSKTTAFGWVYRNHNIATSGGRATLTATLSSLIGSVAVNVSLYCSPTGNIS